MPDIDHMVEVMERYDAIRYGESPWPTPDPDDRIVALDWDRLFPNEARGRSGLHAWVAGAEEFDNPVLQPRAPQAAEPPGSTGDSLKADHCAWYQPAHYFGPEMAIMIRQECVLRLIGEDIPLLPEAVATFKEALIEARAAEDRLRTVLTDGGWLK